MTHIETHECGLSWIEEAGLNRTAHALAADGAVWLVDPFEDAAALERAAALGTPAAVLQLLDRHNRDCAAIARRLGVPHLRVPDAVPDSPLEVVGVVRIPRWHEVALWWPERRALVVSELLGTGHAYRLGPGPVGVHPLLRLRPPGALRAYRPEHLLVGHGRGVHGPDAATGVAEAYARSLRDLPRLAERLPGLLKAAAASRR